LCFSTNALKASSDSCTCRRHLKSLWNCLTKTNPSESLTRKLALPLASLQARLLYSTHAFTKLAMPSTPDTLTLFAMVTQALRKQTLKSSVCRTLSDCSTPNRLQHNHKGPCLSVSSASGPSLGNFRVWPTDGLIIHLSTVVIDLFELDLFD